MVRNIRERCGDARLQACFYALVICFACWLRWDGVSGGFLADDYAQLGMLDGTYPLKRAPWDLFTFSNGELAEGRRLMDVGFYPWWADPTVRISMFRPLASLMIAADHAMFGNNELAYHLHSLFWWVLLLGVVAWLFRMWLPPAVAAVSFLLFSCSNAHGLVLAWICNRSAIIATLFSLLSLITYVRSREPYALAKRLAALLLFAVGLGFGEYALCGLAYFIAYELSVPKDSLGSRAIRLGPFVGAAIVFLGMRNVLGLSMRRSGVYVDALSEPIVFLQAVAERLPVFVADLLFALRADYWTFGAPGMGIELSRDTPFASWFADPGIWRIVHEFVGLAAASGLVAALRAHKHDSVLINIRWLTTGAVVALIPVCGSFPSSRLTLAAAVGLTPLLGALIVTCVKQAWPIAIIVFCLCAAVPCFQQWTEARAFRFATESVKQAILELPADEQDLPSQDIVILGALEGGLSMYLPLTRHYYGRTAPRACWVLSFVPAAYSLERTSLNGFRIRFHGKGTVGSAVTEQLLQSADHEFRVGELLQVGRMRATVVELYEGKPKAIAFDYDRALEEPSLLFLFPSPQGFQRFQPPRVGDSVVVPRALVSTLPPELVHKH